jgi:diguanylate cyclase
MRYAQDRQQSGEIFRRAMELMQRQRAAFTPPHLAIWYEYAAELNPPLAALLERKLAAQEPLSDEDVWHLHGRHVAGRDVEAFERSQAQLRVLLDDTVADLGGVGAAAGELADALGSSTLAADPAQPSVAVLQRRVHSFCRFLRQFSDRVAAKQQQADAILDDLARSQTEPLRDALTGLPNFPGFQRAIDALGVADLQGSVMLVADIDHFKAINDRFGHLMGDRALSAVAGVLREAVSAVDVAARLWGEEFGVFLPSPAGSRAAILAEMIRAGVEGLQVRSPVKERAVCRVTVSIGLAVAMPLEGREQLLHRADVAMYRSKRMGRNRVTVWDEGIDGLAELRRGAEKHS